MKVLFSVYLENRLTEEKQLYFTDIIETKLTISQIDKHLEVNDQFRSVLEAGQNLAFWEIYCFHNFTQDVINKIKTIPSAKTQSPVIEEPTVLEIQEMNPGNSNAVFYPSISECYFYRVTKVECGASGFSAIIAYIKDDPILSGIIVEVIKMMVLKLWRLIFRRKNIAKTQYKRKRLYFHAKQFYSNFKILTNIERVDCQIVGLQKIKGVKFKVKVRTINNEVYEVKATDKGKIETLEKWTNKKL